MNVNCSNLTETQSKLFIYNYNNIEIHDNMCGTVVYHNNY